MLPDSLHFVGVHEETVSTTTSSPYSSSSSSSSSPNDTNRGGRMIHYSLKRQDGSLMLAVVGVERNFRHVSYVIQEEFETLLGLDRLDPVASKWRSRRDVVDWLKSFIRTESTFSSCEPSTLGNSKLNNDGLFDQEMGGIKQKDSNIEKETYMQETPFGYIQLVDHVMLEDFNHGHTKSLMTITCQAQSLY